MTQPGKIEFRDVESPGDLAPNEILLKIQRIGVCGSDIHVFHGKHPATPYPVVQGHEYSAIVHAVGKDVKSAKPGMKATARPQLVCGKCGPCKRGQYNACQELKVQGFQAPGVAQDYFVVPQDRLIILPDSLTLEQGAMIEPAAVGAHSTGRTTELKGKNVVVSGAGTIGNLVAQFAKARGAKKVLITDISDYRLEKAKECGIEATINMYYLGEHELNVFGSMMYRHEDYEAAVEMIANGKINLDPLITKHFPFEKYPEAYKYIEEQGEKTMKVIIDL